MMNLESYCGGGKKWSDSVYILKTELLGFVDGYCCRLNNGNQKISGPNLWNLKMLSYLEKGSFQMWLSQRFWDVKIIWIIRMGPKCYHKQDMCDKKEVEGASIGTKMKRRQYDQEDRGLGNAATSPWYKQGNVAVPIPDE